MTSFGQQRQAPESFGRPAPTPPPAAEEGTMSVGTVFIDVKISPASLARLQEELARAVHAAVEAGFARAGAMDHPEQT